MKKIKFLTVLILLASSYGCKQEGTFAGKGKYGLKFKQELVLPHGKPLREIFGGSSLQIIDTLLLVQHQYENPTYFWEVYSLNNLDHIKSILSRGRGPGEVLFAHYTGQHEKINDDNWMFFFDTNSSKFLKINLDESIRSGKDMVELVSTVSRDKFPYFAIDKDVFLYCNYNRDGGYMSLMKGDNSWKNPVMDKKYHRNITPDDYNKLIHSMYYNKKNNKVCVIPYYVDHI